MENNKRIYLSPPHMGNKERKLMLDAFDSNWIAPLGPHVDAFEEEISNYLNIGHALAVNSGTSALHLAIKLSGIKDGDIVLCPSLTFSSSANVILYEKGIPVFVDVSATSWTIDIFALEIAIKKYNPKVLITVDLYGQSANYREILDLCNKYNIIIIEDAAEALGAEYKGSKCGVFGRLGVLSFNGNKIITTSGGGMLVSDYENLIDKARFLSSQAREPVTHYEHKELGYNYRLSNLLAAIGRGQLESLDMYVDIRRKIFHNYYVALKDIEGIEFMPEITHGKSSRWLTALTIDPLKTKTQRNDIIIALEKENIEARPVWKPMHLQPLYKKNKYIANNKEDVSFRLFKHGLCLPSGSSLHPKDQARIIDIIFSVLKKSKG